MERKPPRPRRVSEGSSEHEVYLPTGALSPNRQTRDPLPDTLLKRVKQFSGRLSFSDDEIIRLETDCGEVVEINLNDIKKANLIYEWSKRDGFRP